LTPFDIALLLLLRVQLRTIFDPKRVESPRFGAIMLWNLEEGVAGWQRKQEEGSTGE
jgi:hypothetical protein